MRTTAEPPQPDEPPRPDEHQSPLDPVPLEPVPPPERRGRAGRNLAAAVGVGVALGALVLASLYLVKAAFVAVAAAALVLASWELRSAFRARGIELPVVPVAAGTVVTLVAGFGWGEAPAAVAAALTVVVALVLRMRGGVEGFVRDATATAFAVVWLPLLASFAMLLLRAPDGADRVVVFILVTVCSDIGGYVVGVLAGRHPMAPGISPKKSWEGLAGSTLFCGVGGALSVALLLGGSWWQGLLVGLGAVCTATLGDLVESMVKRDLGIKDMGTLLPGHGGIMDRLDSLLPTAPVVYALLALLVAS